MWEVSFSPPFSFKDRVGEEFQLLDVGLYNFLVEVGKFES